MPRERIARQCICCGGDALKKSPAVLMPFIAKRVFDHEPLLITPELGLRDLQSGIAYSVCNTMQCQSCGALFLDIRFSNMEMASLYAGYRNEEYTRLRDLYEPGYSKLSESYSERHQYIAEIEKFLTPHLPDTPMILDWGGDTGINTPLIHSARTVHIYDISNKPTLEGTHAVSLEAARQAKYDLIVCSQVLEHVPYPQDILSEIVTVMGHDTLLYVEVPYEELMRTNAGSRDIHYKKHHWHEHINFFSTESLEALLAQEQLQLMEMRTHMISLGWRDSCLISVLCRRT